MEKANLCMKILKSVLRVNYNYESSSIEFGAGLMGPKFINGCEYQDVQNRNTFERIHKLDFHRCFTNNSMFWNISMF